MITNIYIFSEFNETSLYFIIINLKLPEGNFSVISSGDAAIAITVPLLPGALVSLTNRVVWFISSYKLILEPDATL